MFNFCLQGFSDFAGSAVVHLSGGILALVGTVFIGARKNRFVAAVRDAFKLLRGGGYLPSMSSAYAAKIAQLTIP